MAVAMRASLPLCVSEKSSRLPSAFQRSRPDCRGGLRAPMRPRGAMPPRRSLPMMEGPKSVNWKRATEFAWHGIFAPARNPGKPGHRLNGNVETWFRQKGAGVHNSRTLPRLRGRKSRQRQPRCRGISAHATRAPVACKPGEGIDRNRRINPMQGIPAALGEPPS